MAGYRDKFIKSFNFIASCMPTKLLIQLSQQKLIVPVYHIISDEKVPHIKHLYAVKNTNQFKKDLDFLLKNYSPISYSDFQELILKSEKPKKNSFILTFDDGLSEFYDVIAPILLQKGIPAINFLNSGFVDNKDLFFRYKVSLLIEEISKEEAVLKKKDIQNWFNQFPKSLNYKKTLREIHYHNKGLLDELATILQIDFHTFLSEKKPYLSSDQIIDLQKKGFHFGAHSVDHPEYRFLDLQEQIRQTKDCIISLEKSKLLTNKIFAFPFTDYGVSKDFFQNVLETNKIVDITFGSAGLKKDISPFHIQRIPFEISNLSAKQILNSELMYYIVKSFFNKNTITRH